MQDLIVLIAVWMKIDVAITLKTACFSSIYLRGSVKYLLKISHKNTLGNAIAHNIYQVYFFRS